MKNPTKFLVLLFILWCNIEDTQAQNSVPFQWTEAMLTAIRNDFARPPMTARNLQHFSMAMYDAWAAYDDEAATLFLGKTYNGFTCPYSGILQPDDKLAAQNMAMSYAAYRIIRNRYINSPGWGTVTLPYVTTLMGELGYDINFSSVDYSTGNPAALGNYIAARIISYGNGDGSNQLMNYANQYYTPLNPALFPTLPGTNGIIDANRWQPLSLSVFIDQNGNLLSGAPPFMGPEWGNVKPFAMDNDDLTIQQRDGYDWKVYHDPGPFPLLGETGEGINDLYKWNFALVAAWGSHLDPNDEEMIDISPKSVGNATLPTSLEDQMNFYDFENGGDNGIGHNINPITNQPYAEQWVYRGDYTRILAEFWADGPNSETPPGHWFKILNYVITEMQGTFLWEGNESVDETEFCVRAYLTLGGAVHDAAISAWGIKGFYDGVRPISAIRYMAEKGQSSDPSQPHYHPDGFPLIPGFSELVQPGDPLAGADNENVNKVKLYSWNGPELIDNPDTDMAGVGWILGEKWYPYQRPTFVTPPFAGYVSGHSTYSRAAADVMTAITGTPYFPGGMGTFEAPMNQYLVFEEGPSMNVQLQWATYQDASDQCSLSRIWGGIHPPMDDIAGRVIGSAVAADAVAKADGLWLDTLPKIVFLECPTFVNDAVCQDTLDIVAHFDQPMSTNWGPNLDFVNGDLSSDLTYVDVNWINDSTYRWRFVVQDNNHVINNIDVKIMGAANINGTLQRIKYGNDIFTIDTENPFVMELNTNLEMINEATIQQDQFLVNANFNEPVTLVDAQLISNSLTLQSAELTSLNIESNSILLSYHLPDVNEEFSSPTIQLGGWRDLAGNEMIIFDTLLTNTFIDTQSPSVINWGVSDGMLDESLVGGTWLVQVQFDEPMSDTSFPLLTIPAPMDVSMLSQQWLDAETFEWAFVINDNNQNQLDLIISTTMAVDLMGNFSDTSYFNESIDWEMNPWVESLGCVDSSACNFNALANTDDGSCILPLSPCDDGDSLTVNDMVQLDCTCDGEWVQQIEELGFSDFIYPNPSSDFLNIKGDGEVWIFDAQGKLIWNKLIQGSIRIDVQNWANGSYTVKKSGSSWNWIKSSATGK